MQEGQFGSKQPTVYNVILTCLFTFALSLHDGWAINAPQDQNYSVLFEIHHACYWWGQVLLKKLYPENRRCCCTFLLADISDLFYIFQNVTYELLLLK